MNKRIEKESDGYIRDLMRKRRDSIIGIIGTNAFITIGTLALVLIIMIGTIKPLPTEIYSGSYVLQEIDTDRHGGRHGSNSVKIFVSQNGERFAIPTGLMDMEELKVGQVYDITYYIGLLYQYVYTISDEYRVIISEDDQIEYREENISTLPTVLLIFGGIWMALTLLFNLGFLSWACYKPILEINQKIEKRRAKREGK